MTDRVILIDTSKDRASQAALLVDGRLEDLLIDPPTEQKTPAPGEIYWAKIDRLVPKVGGAFVKLTPVRLGYLREAAGLSEGQGVVVQVTAFADEGKATPVTGRILYKGRLAIHTPAGPGINISRQIKDVPERERLESSALEFIAERGIDTDQDDHDVWKNPGLILRSAAEGASAQDLGDDIAALLTARYRAERLIEAKPPLAHTIGLPQDAKTIATREWNGRIETGPDLFDHDGVWDEIERLKSPRVDLPSGAWMAVETTRAMITVDVNTAGEFGGGASLTANLEAARELPRQLRLRGLGGQITVDFAPLKKSDRKRIEDALKTSFRRDPIETTLAGWTPLGNFELQRKRERRPLSELLP